MRPLRSGYNNVLSAAAATSRAAGQAYALGHYATLPLRVFTMNCGIFLYVLLIFNDWRHLANIVNGF